MRFGDAMRSCIAQIPTCWAMTNASVNPSSSVALEERSFHHITISCMANVGVFWFAHWAVPVNRSINNWWWWWWRMTLVFGFLGDDVFW